MIERKESTTGSNIDLEIVPTAWICSSESWVRKYKFHLLVCILKAREKK